MHVRLSCSAAISRFLAALCSTYAVLRLPWLQLLRESAHAQQRVGGRLRQLAAVGAAPVDDGSTAVVRLVAQSLPCAVCESVVALVFGEEVDEIGVSAEHVVEQLRAVLRDAIANAAPAHAFDSADEFTSLDELPLASPHSRASNAVGAIELLGEYELSPPRPAGLAKRGSRLATRGAIISEDSTADDESRSPSPSRSPSRSPRGGGLRSAAAPTFAVESEVAAAAAVHVDSMEDLSERCERCERCELAELVVSVLVEQLKAAQEDAQHRTMQVTLCTDLTRAAGACEPCTASCASVCVCETRMRHSRTVKQFAEFAAVRGLHTRALCAFARVTSARPAQRALRDGPPRFGRRAGRDRTARALHY